MLQQGGMRQRVTLGLAAHPVAFDVGHRSNARSAAVNSISIAFTR